MGYASRGEEVSLFMKGFEGINCRERKEDSQTHMYLYSVRMGNKIDLEQYMALLSKHEESCSQENCHQRAREQLFGEQGPPSANARPPIYQYNASNMLKNC